MSKNKNDYPERSPVVVFIVFDTRMANCIVVLCTSHGGLLSSSCQKHVFETKSTQLGPTSISLNSTWVFFSQGHRTPHVGPSEIKAKSANYTFGHFKIVYCVS